MAPTKRSAKSDATPTKSGEKSVEKQSKNVATNPDHAPAGSSLPRMAQFPLMLALSFALSMFGRMIISQVFGGELEALTREQDTWEDAAALIVWRISELALGWFGNLDSLEAAAMNVLAHGPALYLLTAFYNLAPATALSALATDVLSIAAPFYLVRPLSVVDDASRQKPNRELLDAPMQLLAAALSTCIYTVTLVLSLRSVMPRVLVVYFRGLPSLDPAYSASYTDVLPVTALFGLAATMFIFTRFVTTGKAKEDAEIENFDPVNASLGETVWWNFWGYTTKTKVVIRRTGAAMFLTGIGTFLACTKTMYGVECTGAIAYASVWVFAALFSGIGLGLVGGD